MGEASAHLWGCLGVVIAARATWLGPATWYRRRGEGVWREEEGGVSLQVLVLGTTRNI